MGERGRELYGLQRSPDNSLMVVCGGEVMVAVAHNAMVADDVVAGADVAVGASATDAVDVVATDGVVVAVGAVDAVVV